MEVEVYGLPEHNVPHDSFTDFYHCSVVVAFLVLEDLTFVQGETIAAQPALLKHIYRFHLENQYKLADTEFLCLFSTRTGFSAPVCNQSLTPVASFCFLCMCSWINRECALVEREFGWTQTLGLISFSSFRIFHPSDTMSAFDFKHIRCFSFQNVTIGGALWKLKDAIARGDAVNSPVCMRNFFSLKGKLCAHTEDEIEPFVNIKEPIKKDFFI